MKRRIKVEVPAAEPEDLGWLVAGLNYVGFELQRRLHRGSNLVLSPASAWLTLLALVPGARGTTREELRAALVGQEGPPADRLPELAGVLADRLTRKTGPEPPEMDPETGAWLERKEVDFFVMEVATAVWTAEGYPLRPEYVETLETALGAAVESLDFGAPNAAADRINSWVAEETRGRVSALVDPGMIRPLTRLVLTNATRFEAAWMSPFPEEDTAPAPFHAPHGEVEVAMMRTKDEFSHVRHPSLEVDVLSLPYRAMEALLLVPGRGDLERLEDTLGNRTIHQLTSGMERKDVTVHMPSFDLSSSLGLQPLLSELGIREALGKSADFAGVTPDPDGLYLSELVHQARIRVDEHGTEATGGTAGALSTLSAEGPEPVTLVVDRPFLFLVRDPRTGAVLFSARVVDPTA